MSQSLWGPATWLFLHTLAATVAEDKFAQPVLGGGAALGADLVRRIQEICFHLPCPECAQHARAFWAKVNTAQIRQKTDLVNVLFVFHNQVNRRKRLPPFPYARLAEYEGKNVVHMYNQFARHFNTRGNMQLLADSFHRDRMMGRLKEWMMQNVRHFLPPVSPVPASAPASAPPSAPPSVPSAIVTESEQKEETATPATPASPTTPTLPTLPL